MAIFGDNGVEVIIEAKILKMIETIEPLSFAKTSDRKVQGVMNDMVHMLKYYNMTESELDLSAKLNNTPYKRKGFAFPRDELKSLLSDI